MNPLPINQQPTTTDAVSSDFNANQISIAGSLPVSPTLIRIVRNAGVGLGISIAGGRGSVPFIADDDVSISFLENCSSLYIFASL